MCLGGANGCTCLQAFNCKRCSSVVWTLGLGLVTVSSSVLLVLFTTYTNFAEGFGDRQQQQQVSRLHVHMLSAAARGATESPVHARRSPVDLGDVVKVGPSVQML